MMSEQAETNQTATKVFSETILPSGKRAVLTRELMGHDMERAYEAAGGGVTNIVSISLALFAQAGRIDGERVAYEDLRHGLSALDAFRLTTWTNAGFPQLDAPENKETPASPL